MRVSAQPGVSKYFLDGSHETKEKKVINWLSPQFKTSVPQRTLEK